MKIRLRLIITFLVACLAFTFWIASFSRDAASSDTPKPTLSVEQVSTPSPAFHRSFGREAQSISTPPSHRAVQSVIEQNHVSEEADSLKKSATQEADPTA